MDKWNELCYLLSNSLPSNTSEQLFELKVIQAFEKLGWSEYRKEIIVRESIQIGSANRITPDLVIKNKEGKGFIVEVKKPSIDINNPSFVNQLSSYMGVFRLELGLLIGEKIQIFVDGKLFNQKGLVLVDGIAYKQDNKSGLEFINMFEKKNFNIDTIIEKAHLNLERRQNVEIITKLRKQLINGDYTDKTIEHLTSELQNSFSTSVVEEVMGSLTLEFIDKRDQYVVNTLQVTSIKSKNNKKRLGNSINKSVDVIENEILKVQSRIPKWFRSPNQKNSKMVIAYFELLEKTNKDISKREYEGACNGIGNFTSGYNGLIKIYAKNNAKIFEEINGMVYLWEPVKEFVINEYAKYKRNAK